MANDMSTDVPKTYEWLARLMRAAGTKRIQAKNMSKKIVVRGEVWVQPKDLLMQEFDKVVLEEREREEKERRETTEKERIEREAVERAEREEAEARARAEQEASLNSESAEAKPITKQDCKPLSSSPQPQMDPTPSESPAFSESSDQSDLVQHSPPNWDYNEQTIKECIKTCLNTQDIERAIGLFQEIPNDRQPAFVKDCIAAAFEGGSDSVTVIEGLFKAARTQGICTPNVFQRGFVPAVESADNTSMNTPRTYEWLARLTHAAELTKARIERLAEGIAVDGKPRLEPKYLLAYEFEKLLVDAYPMVLLSSQARRRGKSQSRGRSRRRGSTRHALARRIAQADLEWTLAEHNSDRPSPLSISTTASERPKRPVPGALDLTSAQVNQSAAPPSALASARIIEDLNAVSYPEAIKTPSPDLNIAATPGKFRYDRDRLLQFMSVCKKKPDSLPPLDAIGLEPGE
ncbi:hypothetical protein FRC12_012028 [Ceratobasidium sp. 428]|nr:hypothetical protein FRC12_012028 [Ceratobasidium sp. 428]